MVQHQRNSYQQKSAKIVPGENGLKANPGKSLEMNKKENGVRKRAGSGPGLETLIGISARTALSSQLCANEYIPHSNMSAKTKTKTNTMNISPIQTCRQRQRQIQIQ